MFPLLFLVAWITLNLQFLLIFLKANIPLGYTCQCRRHRFDPSVRHISWRGNCNFLQCSCLQNPIDRGTWPATVHKAAKELDMTQWLNNKDSILFHIHCVYICMCIYIHTYISHLLYQFLRQWTFRLLQCPGYWK